MISMYLTAFSWLSFSVEYWKQVNTLVKASIHTHEIM